MAWLALISWALSYGLLAESVCTGGSDVCVDESVMMQTKVRSESLGASDEKDIMSQAWKYYNEEKAPLGQLNPPLPQEKERRAAAALAQTASNVHQKEETKTATPEPTPESTDADLNGKAVDSNGYETNADGTAKTNADTNGNAFDENGYFVPDDPNATEAPVDSSRRRAITIAEFSDPTKNNEPGVDYEVSWCCLPGEHPKIFTFNSKDAKNCDFDMTTKPLTDLPTWFTYYALNGGKWTEKYAFNLPEGSFHQRGKLSKPCSYDVMEPNQLMEVETLPVEHTPWHQLPLGLDRIDQSVEADGNDGAHILKNYGPVSVASKALDGQFNPLHFPERGEGIHIYVVGTGLNYDHAELVRMDRLPRVTSRILAGMEWKRGLRVDCKWDDTDCAKDEHGVGTHTASVIAGGLNGVARGAVLHGVKYMDVDGRGSWWGLAYSINWVTISSLMGPEAFHSNTYGDRGHRPAIIAIMGNSAGKSQTVDYSVETAVRSGIAVIVSAGNKNLDACKFTPSFISDAFTVGAMNPARMNWGNTSADSKLVQSNFGQCVDMWAPGAGIVASVHYNPSSGRKASGTEAAMGHVAGAAALVYARSMTEYTNTSDPNNDIYVATQSSRALPYGSEMTYWLSYGAAKNTVTGLGDTDRNDLLFIGVGSQAAMVHEDAQYWGEPGEITTTWAPPIGAQSAGDDDASVGAQSAGEEEVKKAESGLSACFPEEATVQVRGRGDISMADVNTGDYVLTKDAYEPVLGFLHVLGARSTKYVVITHSVGMLRASANHLVFLADGSDKPAAEIQVGDVVLSAEGASSVLSVRQEASDSGMYAPLTASGTLLVDGTLASSYAAPAVSLKLPHSAAHAVFFPLRVFTSLFSMEPQGVAADWQNPLLDAWQAIGLGAVQKFLVSA